MSAAPHVLTIDWLGRPLLANQVHRMHWAKVGRERTAWGDAAIQAARIAKLPKLHRVALAFHAEYPTRRSLPDPDGIAPSAKGVIDGLVRGGFLRGDTAEHVASVTYLPPRVVTGERPALVVAITQVCPQPIPVRTGTEAVAVFCGACDYRTPVVSDRRTARQVFDAEHGGGA